MDRVELVGTGVYVLHPVPLDDGGLNERCRGVGVVFQQLGGTDAVPENVEAAVEGGRLLLPCPLDEGDRFCWDFKVGVKVVVDDVLCGGEAHGLQFVTGGFNPVDFARVVLLGLGLVPVTHVGWGVEGEPLGLDDALPMVTGRLCVPLHGHSPPPPWPLWPPSPPWLEKLEPKPPRAVPVVVE